MFPEFPEYKKEINKQILIFLKERIKFHNRIISEIPQKDVIEGKAIKIIHQDDTTDELFPKLVKSSFEIPSQFSIENVNELIVKLDESAQEMANQQIQMLFSTVENAAVKTGNILTGELTSEKILKMYEKIEIRFEDGKPILPEFFGGTEMCMKVSKIFTEIQENKELKERFEEIIEQKRIDWNDRQINRKLVG
jgi:paraquat-inducible protein B